MLFLLHAVVTTQKTADDANVSVLWRWNVYCAIMARLLFDAAELEFYIQRCKITRNWTQTHRLFQFPLR